MSKGPSIYDGLPYLYAEQLRGKRVTLTIKEVKGGAKFHEPNSHETKVGFDVIFEETDKKLGITGVTVRRQLYVATGTENPKEMAGHKIILYPVKSKKSATGEAIRIAPLVEDA